MAAVPVGKKYVFFCKYCEGEIQVHSEAPRGKIRIIAECKKCHAKARKVRDLAKETIESPYSIKNVKARGYSV